jgi:NTE family protein
MPLLPRLFCLTLALGLALGCTGSPAQTVLPGDPPIAPIRADGQRAKIGLVLSGGGVRGLAHIGVLKVLRERKIPVDLVVGTSMGAVVGGAYASGRSIEEMEAFVQHTDWPSVLADRPPRQNLSFRRREEDQTIPSRLELGVDPRGGRTTLPPSAAGNSALEAALESLVRGEQAETPISQLRLPFRALATDLLNGDLVEMVDTPLFLAMRASMAVPGVFSPVRVNGRAVVDGGLVRNLGVDVARKMGADIIIAVNVGSPLLEEREITSAVGVANQMLQILTNQNVAQSLRELRSVDVLIDPDLGNISFMDFSRFEEAMRSGERAAHAALERLTPLAVDDEHFARYEQGRLREPAPLSQQALPLASLKIEGTQRSNPKALREELGLHVGKPASPEDIKRATAALYGLGDFERIDAQVSDVEGQRHLTLHVQEAEWAHNRLRFGLSLKSNFGDTNGFTISAMHVSTWLNRWGAELRSSASLGENRSLSFDLIQPLGAGSPWYLNLITSNDNTNTDTHDALGRRSMRLSVGQSSTELAIGRRLSNWGDVRLGLVRATGAARAVIPEPEENPTIRYRVSGGFAELRADTLDSLAFPSRGHMLLMRMEYGNANRNAEALRVGGVGLAAFRAGRWAGHVYTEWQHAALGSAGGSLGGFLRLSGTNENSLEGRTLGFGRLVMARRIGEMPIGLGGAIRAGMSLELGGIIRDRELFDRSQLKLAGSTFLAFDTRFGPFYLALGGTYKGQGTAYLFLGPTW